MSRSIQLAKSGSVMQGELLLCSARSLQHKCLTAFRELPMPMVVEACIAILIGHSGGESMIGEEIHLVLNSGAVCAWQGGDKRCRQG
jgi:hypothetical protein